MTEQTKIPCVLMRGGTSKGPFFQADDLPVDPSLRDLVLLAAMGSPDTRQIDGIGGADPLTSKVAIVSPSAREGVDVEYLFAQVVVAEPRVDVSPTCGNMLTGVAPFAIEQGMVKAADGETRVRIYMVNTDTLCVATVQTPRGAMTYDGDACIDGVPGTAAPVRLDFLDVAGSNCGALLPTGNLRDVIDGIEVTCMDVAMPMVIARAADFGLTGYESVAELDANKDFFARMEAIRLQAGAAMGMGDVAKSVTPKFGLLAPARDGGTIGTRYFMPWNTHPSMAVTGAQCLASCALTPGSVAEGLLERPIQSPADVVLEHASGTIDVLVDYDTSDGFALNSAGLLRTARKLADGCVFVPSRIWEGR